MYSLKSKKFSTKASDYSTFDLLFVKNSHKEALKVLNCKPKEGFQTTKAGAIVISVEDNLEEAFTKYSSHYKKIAILTDEEPSPLAVNLALQGYRFQAFKSDKKNNTKSITLVTSKKFDLAAAKASAESICFARDLVNTPASSMTPSDLAKKAKELGKNISVKIYSKAELAKLGCEGILSVSKGSAIPPCLIHLRHGPKSAKKSICLVGKGVTFDSGGYSLKSPKGMSEMKCDMAGAGAVMGVFHNLAKKKARNDVCINGLIPCAENMVNSIAIKPGDVYTAMNGTTVEVLNTDAEGRLLLADALCFAQKKLKSKNIISIATLTGAAVAALGEKYAALLGNSVEFNQKILNVGSEQLWELPLAEEYKSKLQSKVADIKNNPGTPGTITAALFLEHFIESSCNWGHIDIAGPAFVNEEASGFGVKTLTELCLGRAY